MATLTRALRVFRAPSLRLRVAPSALACRQTRWISTSYPCFTSTVEAAAVHHEDVQATPYTPASQKQEKQRNDDNNNNAASDSAAPFSKLKNVITDETLKAITVRPFRFTHMTPVQESVLSLLPDIALPLSQARDSAEKPRDVMVKAKTGTGKTLAFLVPAIEARVKALEEAGKMALEKAGSAGDKALEMRAKMKFAFENVGTLILSPTRELASQIVQEAQALTTHHQFAVQALTGGTSRDQQLHYWSKQRKDIVVATTGRLNDLLYAEPSFAKAFRTTQILILDEADRMLDMGFRDDIERILDLLPKTPERQTFLFSATIDKSIEQVARKTLAKDHLYINAVSENESPVHAHVPQYHTVVPTAADQMPHILHLLAHDQLTNLGTSKAIVFLPTTKLTIMFSDFLRELRAVLPAGKATRIFELHSKKNQSYRTKTSQFFRSDKSGASILATSDVSARGVDYPGVTRVIQVGLPSSTEQYIHRVGRTGRTGGTIGRGDLVLLPWEFKFADWQLRKVPLKPLTSGDLKNQLTEISAKYDENPAAFLPKGIEAANRVRRGRSDSSARGRNEGERIVPRTPVSSKVESIPEEVKHLMSFLDADIVRETFTAQLGYYVSLSDNMNIDRDMVLQGCREWAMQALGQERAPHVSESFLRQLGFKDGEDEGRGRGRGRSSSSSSPFGSGGGRSRAFVGGGIRDRDGRKRGKEGTWLSEGGGPRTRGHDYQRGSKRMFTDRQDDEMFSDRDEGHGFGRRRDNSRGGRESSYQDRSRAFSRRAQAAEVDD